MDMDLQELLEKQDIDHRLLCAIDGRPYETPAEREKIARLVEALHHGAPHTPLPTGIDQRLAEALGGEPALPDGIEARLARAL